MEPRIFLSITCIISISIEFVYPNALGKAYLLICCIFFYKLKKKTLEHTKKMFIHIDFYIIVAHELVCSLPLRTWSFVLVDHHLCLSKSVECTRAECCLLRIPL